MLPITVSAPPSRRPVVSIALAVVLVGVFVHVLLLRRAPVAPYCTDLDESARALRASAGTVQAFVCRWGVIPDEVHKGQRVGTLLTALFVHVSWLHLLVNVVILGAFAPRVEEDLGPLGLPALFLGGGVLSGAVHVLLVPDLVDPTVGASGAVAAVLGAHLLLAPRGQVRVLVGPVPVRLPTWYVIGLWAALQLVYTAQLLHRAEYAGGESYEVHTAGFAVGLLVTLVVLAARPDLRRWRAPTAGPDVPRASSNSGG